MNECFVFLDRVSMFMKNCGNWPEKTVVLLAFCIYLLEWCLRWSNENREIWIDHLRHLGWRHAESKSIDESTLVMVRKYQRQLAEWLISNSARDDQVDTCCTNEILLCRLSPSVWLIETANRMTSVLRKIRQKQVEDIPFERGESKD